MLLRRAQLSICTTSVKLCSLYPCTYSLTSKFINVISTVVPSRIILSQYHDIDVGSELRKFTPQLLHKQPDDGWQILTTLIKMYVKCIV